MNQDSIEMYLNSQQNQQLDLNHSRTKREVVDYFDEEQNVQLA
jgi:hypothetical protein